MRLHDRLSQRDRRHFAFCGLLFGTLLALGAAGRAQQVNFDPSAPEKFDGRGWNGLTFDQSTTDDIKKACKTSKGAYRPEAMVLPQPSGSKTNVQVLMDGRGGKSRLIGFRLAYSDAGPDLQKLASSLGESSETLYPRERFSDWRVQAFRKTGIAAFVVRDGVKETVPLLLLTSPDRLGQLTRGFGDSPPPIGNLRTRFNPEDVTIQFGQININFREGETLIANPGDLVSRLSDMARNDSGSRHLQYAGGNQGYYNVDISLSKHSDNAGTVSVSVLTNGDGPFGKVSGSGYGSAEFTTGDDGMVSPEVVIDSFRRARNEMGGGFTEQIRRGLPSSPKAYRELVWNALMDSAVR